MAILARGSLLSRMHAEEEGVVENDIAPQDIIDNRSDAHSRVRLYFRPRTPTQFHIEGIRKPKDFYQGKHAGFLVMLVLDAEALLTQPETQFSCGNMQSHASKVYSDDAGFDQLEFSGIYHDEAYPSPDQILQRCAEVLSASPLSLENTLKHIIVRTDADVQTLNFRLDDLGLAHLLGKVRKAQGAGVFFNYYTALDFIDSEPSRIAFGVKESLSGANIDIRMRVSGVDDGRERTLFDTSIESLKRYYFEHDLPAGTYRVRVDLEGCLAHESVIELY
ncbi:MAG: DarT ssDNA thymidine ADP-ribosyltransferase family protein [Pseudomonadales bacterium]